MCIHTVHRAHFRVVCLCVCCQLDSLLARIRRPLTRVLYLYFGAEDKLPDAAAGKLNTSGNVFDLVVARCLHRRYHLASGRVYSDHNFEENIVGSSNDHQAVPVPSHANSADVCSFVPDPVVIPKIHNRDIITGETLHRLNSDASRQSILARWKLWLDEAKQENLAQFYEQRSVPRLSWNRRILSWLGLQNRKQPLSSSLLCWIPASGSVADVHNHIVADLLGSAAVDSSTKKLPSLYDSPPASGVTSSPLITSSPAKPGQQ